MTVKTYWNEKAQKVQEMLVEDSVFISRNKKYIAIDIMHQKHHPDHMDKLNYDLPRFISEELAPTLKDNITIPITRHIATDQPPLILLDWFGFLALKIKTYHGVDILCVEYDKLLDALENEEKIYNSKTSIDVVKCTLKYAKAKRICRSGVVMIHPLHLYYVNPDKKN